MVDDVASSSEATKRPSTGFLVTVSAILALLTNRVKKSKAAKEEEWRIDLKAPKSRPKKLLNSISNKALFGHHKKNNSNSNSNININNKKRSAEETAEAWGNGGVWQKEILMGGKCEPLDFSGVIYYDGNGKQLSQIPPRSPRASPLPGYLARRTPERKNY